MFRVLLLYTPAGGGHRAAANAIAAELRALPAATIEVRDVLEFAPRWFAYDRAWQLFQHHGTRAWDWVFDITERGSLDLDPVRLPLHAKLFAPLDRFLRGFRPTHIVCTHYLPALAVARVKAELGARTIITITDHLAHRAWLVPGTDAYCVADPTVARAVRRHTTAEVHVTGIPIARTCAAPVRAVPALGANRVLALLGGLPRGDAFAAIDALAPLARRSAELTARSLSSFGAHTRSLHVLVGDAPEVAAHAHAKLPAATIAARAAGLLGAIDNADVVITKAGGLTVSECLARGRAMVLPFNAPGQERGNLFYALDAGAAVRPELADLGDVVDDLLAEPNRLRRMSARARFASRPSSAAHVAQLLVDRAGVAHAA